MENNENVWEDLLENLMMLDYREGAAVTAIEQKIYASLQRQPDAIEGLITLMFEQIMLGNRTKAKALAYKIWEIGGELNRFFEEIYTENLLNLGLVDMAAVLLKNRFDDLHDTIGEFYPVLVKFALMTGNIAQLNRLGAYPEAVDDTLLFALAEVYQKAGAAEAFKNIQQLIWEQVGEYLCSYEYNLYDDRGFPELEIVLYINFEEGFCRKMEDGINAKIEAFWRSSGLTPLHNISVRTDSIKNHPAWTTEEKPETESNPAADWGMGGGN